jgi:dTDP-glucose 4,6-dehydratase
VDNIAHLGGNPNFKFIQQDVTEFIFLDAPVDYVWHFASPASPIDYLELPIQTLKVGSLGTHKALGLAKEKGARFLIASTSEIYGDPLVHPQTEEYWGNVNTIGPRGCYDEAKRFAEALTMAYHREHKVETRIVRIFNTYGPRMRLNDGRVVPAFISQALKNKPVTVFGRGRQTRSFCYVSRFDRRHLSPDDEQLRFAGEHRQPGGNDHAAVRRTNHPRHPLAQQNRFQAAAAG